MDNHTGTVRMTGIGNLASVLRHRNYRLLWIGTLVSNTGDWMDQVALNWLVLQTTGSAVDLGLVNLFRGLPIMALTLIGGVAADRFERRRLMMISQAIGMALAFILAAMVFFNNTPIWAIFAIAAARGAVISFNQPARHSLVSEVVPRPLLPPAIALNALTMNLTKVLGPLLAGVVIAAWGTAACFAVNALSLLVVQWSLSRMVFPPRSLEKEPESVLQSLKVGFSYLGTNSVVLALVLVAFIPVFFGQPYIHLLALFTIDVFQSGPETLGALTACAALGSVGGALCLALIPATARSGIWMLIAMLAFGLGICVFTFAESPVYAGVLLISIGATQTFCNASNNILLQSIVPDAVRGRVLSVLLLNKGFVQMGTAAGATLAAIIGVGWALFAFGCVVVCSAVAILLVARLFDGSGSDKPQPAGRTDEGRSCRARLLASAQTGTFAELILPEIDTAPGAHFDHA
nr:MFS transporter [Aminobacter aminovorans]